jgi:hypothetical protein
MCSFRALPLAQALRRAYPAELTFNSTVTYTTKSDDNNIPERKKRSDARRSRGEGIPPKSALPQASGPNEKTSLGQAKQRDPREKTGRHAKRRTALADARRSSAVGFSASSPLLGDMKTHRQPQKRGRARPNCKEQAKTTLRKPNRCAFFQVDAKPKPNPPDTSPPSPPPPPDGPDIDPPAEPIATNSITALRR